MAGAEAFLICQGSFSEKRCGIRRLWNWQMCWDTKSFGRRGEVSAYDERTESECRSLCCRNAEKWLCILVREGSSAYFGIKYRF